MADPTGFSYRATRDGLVSISHHGRVVTHLRGAAAVSFLSFAGGASEQAMQHRMARVTGNYKRGNERRST